MNSVRAIETHYNGYRFRSRLEARWAVFFDTLGVVYHYERDSFISAEGVGYIPDFYLPQLHAYIEVKPSPPSSSEQEKAYIAMTATDAHIVFVRGEPGKHDEYQILLNKVTPSVAAYVCSVLDAPLPPVSPACLDGMSHRYMPLNGFGAARAIEAIIGSMLELDWGPVLTGSTFARELAQWWHKCRKIQGISNDLRSSWRLVRSDILESIFKSAQYGAAVRAARSARFEFGESGPEGKPSVRTGIQVASVKPPEFPAPFSVGQRVTHVRCGDGVVIARQWRNDDWEIDVKFEAMGANRMPGIKRLSNRQSVVTGDLKAKTRG